MSGFKLLHRANNSVWALYRQKSVIEADPEYQRQSDVWTLEKKQLLIDTIINRFDVPKIYLHKFTRPQLIGDKEFEYAIIDGKQRLSAIWDFIDGKISTSNEFEYFHDKSVKAASLTYREIASKFPDLKSDFDSFQITVVEIETDDEYMIEEMFSRLNEAAPLNAPEKRNAYGGPIPKAIREISNTDLFTSKIPFSNNRYKHFDLATKLLYAEEAGRVVDTKKVFLDKFVQKYARNNRNETLNFFTSLEIQLANMASIFIDRDHLLKSTGMVMVYYYIFKQAMAEGWQDLVTRANLLSFEELRVKNREQAKTDLAQADYELLEFDKYNQSPNDKYAIEIRLKVILERLFSKKLMDELMD